MLLNPGSYTLSLGVADCVTDYDFKSLDARNNIESIVVYGKTFAYGLIHNNGKIIISDGRATE